MRREPRYKKMHDDKNDTAQNIERRAMRAEDEIMKIAKKTKFKVFFSRIIFIIMHPPISRLSSLRRRTSCYLFMFFSLLSLLSACSFSEHRATTNQTHMLLEEAEKHRQHALEAKEQETAFKEIGSALQLYLQVEQRLKKTGATPSNELYIAIANSYALLRTGGSSLFYYRQALVNAPRDKALQAQINRLEQSLKLPPTSFGSFPLSLQEMLYLTIALLTLSFVIASCSIWLHSKRLKQLSLGVLLLACLPLLLALYIAAALPLEATVIESTPIYRLPQSPSSSAAPHTHLGLEGTQVEVLGQTSDPTWLMIRLRKTSEKDSSEAGTPFYVPSHSIRLIERKI